MRAPQEPVKVPNPVSGEFSWLKVGLKSSELVSSNESHYLYDFTATPYNRKIVKLDPLDQDILNHLAQGAAGTSQIGNDLGYSRQAIHAHLKRLATLGMVEASGRGPATRWSKTVDVSMTWPLYGAAEDQIWRQFRNAQAPLLEGASGAALRSLDYGATEMINNAIDHSQGSTVQLNVRKRQNNLSLEIIDDGVGVFANVRRHFFLDDERSALAHLSKGKQTTAQQRHSGQGIFFTSKIFDRFVLQSHELLWWIDNLRKDQTVKSAPRMEGTRVEMLIDLATDRMPRDVFDRFTDSETLDFDKSTFHVKLVKYGRDFVSRSEAKRLAGQLQLFGEVVLDFEDVDAVGQGFVDELFRVWIADNPGTRLLPINMNEDVAFMVNRGLG